jgi:stress-induced morphogen
LFSADRIKKLIEAGLPGAVADVRDDANDGQHFSARVASSAFVGKSLPAQHRLVYGTLGDHMRSDIHALALRTYTPDNWPG